MIPLTGIIGINTTLHQKATQKQREQASCHLSHTEVYDCGTLHYRNQPLLDQMDSLLPL